MEIKDVEKGRMFRLRGLPLLKEDNYKEWYVITKDGRIVKHIIIRPTSINIFEISLNHSEYFYRDRLVYLSKKEIKRAHDDIRLFIANNEY